MLQVDMSASKRESFGKGAMRRLRVSGKTPAVMYGNNNEVCSLQLETTSFLKGLFQISRKNAVINISIDGDETRHVLVKEIQTDPVHDTLVHVDFYEIDLSAVRRFTVPLELTGKAKGLEFGGDLVVHADILDLEGTPLDIPDSIKIDISDLGIGESLQFSDLDLPENVKMVADGAELCVEVVAPAV